MNVPKQQLADHIRAQVLSLAWAPGQDLDESTLSSQFGVSRTPLREVFRDLAGAGYLTLQPNRQARVAELSHQTLREFFQTAPMIYAAILRLAASQHRAEQLAQLQHIQDRFAAALACGDSSERALANHAFHVQTADMAANRYLRPSFDRLLIDHTRIAQTFYRGERPTGTAATACDQHQSMIDAIAAGDADRASQLALDHWALSRDQFLQFVMPPALAGERGSNDEI